RSIASPSPFSAQRLNSSCSFSSGVGALSAMAATSFLPRLMRLLPPRTKLFSARSALQAFLAGRSPKASIRERLHRSQIRRHAYMARGLRGIQRHISRARRQAEGIERLHKISVLVEHLDATARARCAREFLPHQE